MEAWEKQGYESAADYVRDRFDDEREYVPYHEPVCGDCSEWTRCSIQGHENIGWCSKWDEFFEVDDDWCGDD